MKLTICRLISVAVQQPPKADETRAYGTTPRRRRATTPPLEWEQTELVRDAPIRHCLQDRARPHAPVRLRKVDVALCRHSHGGRASRQMFTP